MNTDELYTYILTAFEGKSFENIILKKNNSEYKNSFEDEYRDKIIEAMNTEEYSKVMNKLAKSFLTNLAKGTNSSKFTKKQCDDILDIYHKLVENIANRDLSYEKIALEHFTNVRNYINAYTSGEAQKNATTEYSPEFVLSILDVEKSELNGKILDIGCGKNGALVKYLRNQNLEAYGIDMECEDSETLEQEDWLVKEYPSDMYNVIISNLTFTKHFNEANLEEQNDQECIEYAQAYMKILNSLKVGGKWHYVPAVTFIEELLPEDKFEVKNSFVNENVMKTTITKLK